MSRDQRRLTAIVSADVAGYSRLMSCDESGTQSSMDSHADYSRIAREMNEYTARAVDLNPTDPLAWAWRGVALTFLGRWDAALEANAMAIKLEPDEPRFYDYRSNIMNMMGRPAEGLALAERALTMDPTNTAEPMLRACWSYLLLGQADQAIEMCEKASALWHYWGFQVLPVAAYADHGDMAKTAAAKADLLRTVPGYSIAQARFFDRTTHPEAYTRLAEKYFYEGLRKAEFQTRRRALDPFGYVHLACTWFELPPLAEAV